LQNDFPGASTAYFGCWALPLASPVLEVLLPLPDGLDSLPPLAPVTPLPVPAGAADEGVAPAAPMLLRLLGVAVLEVLVVREADWHPAANAAASVIATRATGRMDSWSM
jgi:hypothetical protein